MESMSEKIGQHILESRLGSGAMGSVWSVTNRLGRRYALKVLHEEQSRDATFRARFLTEASLMSKLGATHPNILEVDDFHEEADGCLWMRMPLVEGVPDPNDVGGKWVTLRDRMNAEGQLELGYVRRSISEILSALAYAHGESVLHRDLKPENILLTEQGILLADFGLAKALDQAQANAQMERSLLMSMTGDWNADVESCHPDDLSQDLVESIPGMKSSQARALIGTLAYMAPELKPPGFEPHTERSDLYAVGLMAFQMLSGVPELGAGDRLTDFRNQLDSSFDDWLFQAIARLPERRFSSALEMKESWESLFRDRDESIVTFDENQEAGILGTVDSNESETDKDPEDYILDAPDQGDDEKKQYPDAGITGPPEDVVTTGDESNAQGLVPDSVSESDGGVLALSSENNGEEILEGNKLWVRITLSVLQVVVLIGFFYWVSIFLIPVASESVSKKSFLVLSFNLVVLFAMAMPLAVMTVAWWIPSYRWLSVAQTVGIGFLFGSLTCEAIHSEKFFSWTIVSFLGGVLGALLYLVIRWDFRILGNFRLIFLRACEGGKSILRKSEGSEKVGDRQLPVSMYQIDEREPSVAPWLTLFFTGLPVSLLVCSASVFDGKTAVLTAGVFISIFTLGLLRGKEFKAAGKTFHFTFWNLNVHSFWIVCMWLLLGFIVLLCEIIFKEMSPGSLYTSGSLLNALGKGFGAGVFFLVGMNTILFKKVNGHLLLMAIGVSGYLSALIVASIWI